MADEGHHRYDAADLVSEGVARPDDDVSEPPVDPVELEAKYLLGLEFPATKERVLAEAHLNDAPRRVLDVLERLEEQEYANVTELLKDVT